MTVCERVLQTAKRIWVTEWYPHHQTDRLCNALKVIPMETGWLRRVRTASFLSQRELARRMKISLASYSRFEDGERDGSIAIRNLRRCAEALDCELVYGLRPKGTGSISDRVWSVLANPDRPMKLPPKIPDGQLARLIAAQVKARMESASFNRGLRRKRGPREEKQKADIAAGLHARGPGGPAGGGPDGPA